MQENLTDVSERLEEKAVKKAAGSEAINLVSYPSCGSKRLCSDEGVVTSDIGEYINLQLIFC